MSANGFARKRDKNEKAIVETLESVGASVQRLSMKGVPDLLVTWTPPNMGRFADDYEKTLLIEIKAPKGGKFTKDQIAWRAHWKGSYHVATTGEYALKLLGLRIRQPGIWTWCSHSGCSGSNDINDGAGCAWRETHRMGTYRQEKVTK